MFKAFSRSSDELYQHMSALGANLESAALRFEAMVLNWGEREERFFAIRETEHEGDRLLRELHDYLKETFFVPGDRESIYSLTNEIDDVVDKTLKIANYLLLYRIDAPAEPFKEMCRLLAACCVNLRKALALLGDRSQRENINTLCLEVVELEDEADKVYRRGLEKIFDHPTDLGALLKWKDILDWTDDTVDHANHCAYKLIALNGILH